MQVTGLRAERGQRFFILWFLEGRSINAPSTYDSLMIMIMLVIVMMMMIVIVMIVIVAPIPIGGQKR